MKNTNKELKIEIPEGYEIDKQKSSFEKIVFRKIKPALPTKWEDLKIIKGYFIDRASEIRDINGRLIPENHNVFASKEEAEAALALAMLSQLKRVYNTQEDGSIWEPDWNSNTDKYGLTFENNRIVATKRMNVRCFLAFKDAETRGEFLNNFEDLILKAKPLL